jgi:hypothetical protein
MIICHSRRFAFVHIHKTGGTSIELALDPFLTWSDLVLGSTRFGETINQHYHHRFGLDKHSSVQDIETICGQEIARNYYLFATVRHPLDRLCSIYNYIGSLIYDWAEKSGIAPSEVAAHLTEEACRRAPFLIWPTSRAFLGTPAFSEFIRDARLSGDRAFHTQLSRLRSVADGRIYAEALRLEDRSAWLPALRAKLGWKFDLPHSNESRLKLISRTMVSPDDRRFVEDCFSEDYAAFGYE